MGLPRQKPHPPMGMLARSRIPHLRGASLATKQSQIETGIALAKTASRKRELLSLPFLPAIYSPKSHYDENIFFEQPINLSPLITMASKYWIKLYHEILDDPKMARLSDECWRRAIELFLLAGDYAKEGLLPPFPDIAWRLRVDEGMLQQSFQELQSLGIVAEYTSGEWWVIHFKERQNADSSIERMRRYRDSLQKKEYYEDKLENGPVTKRNADIDIDTDEEGESDTEESSTNDSSNNLSKIFVTQTQIPEYAGGIEKWQQALEQLKRSGIEGQDVIMAVQECAQKNLTITCLTSILKPAIIARSKRISLFASRLSPQDDYRRFTRGKYGDSGIR
jgi:hypothetical protein